jgi:NAD(P)-dependent dehydrogenase (short-subunit alcohol dehydrogenase family)
MDMLLKDKTALVTGSTAGIGFAIASALASEGARVIINGRTTDRVETAKASIRKTSLNDHVEGVAADVATASGINEIISRFPAVDILINNFGLFWPKTFEETTDEEWLRIFEANVLSGARLSRHYFPAMLKAGWGRVIFVSSESGVQIPSEMIHYGVTKTAQIALARGMAELTVGTQVTVNSVLPGPTNSEGVGTFVADLAKTKGITTEEMEREFFDNARPSSLIRRFADPAEVANMVAYIASPRSSATNGAALRVDGGVIRAAL